MKVAVCAVLIASVVVRQEYQRWRLMKPLQECASRQRLLENTGGGLAKIGRPSATRGSGNWQSRVPERRATVLTACGNDPSEFQKKARRHRGS